MLAVRISDSTRDVHVTEELTGLRFSSTVPGGFATAEVEIHRSLAIGDIPPFADLYVYDARSAEVVWQGKVEDIGRGAGPAGEVWSVVAGGPATRARDKVVPLVYVDQGLDAFTPGHSTSRFVDMDSHEEDDDNEGLRVHVKRGTALVQGDKGVWKSAVFADAGMALARVQAKYICGVSGTNNRMRLVLVKDDASTDEGDDAECAVTEQTLTSVITTDFPATTDWTRYNLQFHRDSATTVASDAHHHLFYDIVARAVLYDAEGTALTAASNYTGNTVTADQIIADMLGRLMVGVFDGERATVQGNSFSIDQLAYPDGTTFADVAEDLMRLHPNFYWAAWEGWPARFEWRAWPDEIAYEAVATDGFESPASGAEIYDEVTVRYRGRHGRIKTLVRTSTVAALDNVGLSRRALLDLGDTLNSSAVAAEAGDRFLEEHAAAPNAGTLTISRPIVDFSTGRMVEPFQLRPGRLIRVRDVLPRADTLNRSTRDAVTVFRVVGVDYDSRRHAATLDLDQPGRRLGKLLARRELRRRR